MAKRWTKKEIDYLQAKFGITSINGLARSLGRSKGAVQLKANRLGLLSYAASDSLTLSDFCKCTGISRATVQYWIKNFEFPTIKRRKAKYRYVEPDSFWIWAEKNRCRINWADFPIRAIYPEPDWVEQLRRSNGLVNKRRPWTDWEISELRYLLKQEKYTYPEISERLNRNHSAIKRKIYDLQIPYWPIYVNRGTAERYSEEEIETAVSLYKEGYPLSSISKKLGRTEAGLRGKLERTGYVFKGRKLVKR